MGAIVSLRFLDEPAYVLLGGIVAEREDGTLEVEESAASVVGYVPEAATMVRFFATLRSRTEAVQAVESWGGQASDLETLVEHGTLVCLPPDEGSIRATLHQLSIVVPYPARLDDDRRVVYIRLPSGRAAAISSLSASVVVASGPGVGAGVSLAAQAAEMDEDAVWRATVHDLTSLLLTGAGHLERALP